MSSLDNPNYNYLFLVGFFFFFFLVGFRRFLRLLLVFFSFNPALGPWALGTWALGTSKFSTSCSPTLANHASWARRSFLRDITPLVILLSGGGIQSRSWHSSNKVFFFLCDGIIYIYNLDNIIIQILYIYK